MVDNRNNVLGMITRKDITHHALDEALLRLHAQSSGTTGEVLHVDSGYHVVGMKNPDAPDIATV